MKKTKITNHWLLEAEMSGYITQIEDVSIEEREFYKSIRVGNTASDDYRDATDEEVAEWKAYQKKQEEQYEVLE